jgi:hypothetical protein
MYCRVPYLQMVRLLPRGVIETPIAMGPWFALQTLTVIRISKIPNSCDTSLYKTSKVESLAARTLPDAHRHDAKKKVAIGSGANYF